MEVRELKQKKEQLREDIVNLIKKFEEETEIYVSNIDYYVESMGAVTEAGVERIPIKKELTLEVDF